MASLRRAGVRILAAVPPYNKNAPAGVTQATFSKEFEQFTNNPNPLYDPSKAPGAVKEVSVASTRKAANAPGKSSRGHQKVIGPNRFTLFGGKTLKKRG